MVIHVQRHANVSKQTTLLDDNDIGLQNGSYVGVARGGYRISGKWVHMYK